MSKVVFCSKCFFERSKAYFSLVIFVFLLLLFVGFDMFQGFQRFYFVRLFKPVFLFWGVSQCAFLQGPFTNHLLF